MFIKKNECNQTNDIYPATHTVLERLEVPGTQEPEYPGQVPGLGTQEPDPPYNWIKNSENCSKTKYFIKKFWNLF